MVKSGNIEIGVFTQLSEREFWWEVIYCWVDEPPLISWYPNSHGKIGPSDPLFGHIGESFVWTMKLSAILGKTLGVTQKKVENSSPHISKGFFSSWKQVLAMVRNNDNVSFHYTWLRTSPILGYPYNQKYISHQQWPNHNFTLTAEVYMYY